MVRVCTSSRFQLIFGKCLFLPLIFPGTASGQFLRPAASRLLLSRFLPNHTGPSHKASARLGSSGLSLLGAPGKWGKKKEKIHVLPQLSDDPRLRRRRPGAASSAEQQWLEVHRFVRRDAAVVEEHRRRMGVEDRVASRLRYMESDLPSSH